MFIQTFDNEEHAKFAAEQIHRYMSAHNNTPVQEVLDICDSIRHHSVGWITHVKAAPPVVMRSFEGHQILLPDPIRLISIEEDMMSDGFHVTAYRKPIKLK